MPLLEEIQLNRFQLSRLMSKNQLDFFDQVLADNVFCVRCGTCEKGIQIKKIVLDNGDCLQVTGECNICGGEVCRVIEFEEDPDFKQMAAEFRKSLNARPK
jgi:coenzyme F420-reducing hydrogenase gamma subunit